MWYALNVKKNNELQVCRKILHALNLNSNNEFNFNDYISEVGYPRNYVDKDINSEYRSYIFLNLKTDNSELLIDILLPQLNTLGVLNFIGTEVETGVYKTETISVNKRNKINRYQVIKVSPVKIKDSEIIKVENNHELFNVKLDHDLKLYQFVYYIHKYRKKVCYQRCQVIKIIDDNLFQILFKDGVKGIVKKECLSVTNNKR